MGTGRNKQSFSMGIFSIHSLGSTEIIRWCRTCGGRLHKQLKLFFFFFEWHTFFRLPLLMLFHRCRLYFSCGLGGGGWERQLQHCYWATSNQYLHLVLYPLQANSSVIHMYQPSLTHHTSTSSCTFRGSKDQVMCDMQMNTKVLATSPPVQREHSPPCNI